MRVPAGPSLIILDSGRVGASGNCIKSSKFRQL